MSGALDHNTSYTPNENRLITVQLGNILQENCAFFSQAFLKGAAGKEDCAKRFSHFSTLL